MKDSERNQKGKELEALGDINAAIETYEQNVTILSPAPFPYKRLALIYKKNKDVENEIRVLKALLSILCVFKLKWTFPNKYIHLHYFS